MTVAICRDLIAQEGFALIDQEMKNVLFRHHMTLNAEDEQYLKKQIIIKLTGTGENVYDKETDIVRINPSYKKRSLADTNPVLNTWRTAFINNAVGVFVGLTMFFVTSYLNKKINNQNTNIKNLSNSLDSIRKDLVKDSQKQDSKRLNDSTQSK